MDFIEACKSAEHAFYCPKLKISEGAVFLEFRIEGDESWSFYGDVSDFLFLEEFLIVNDR